MSKAVITIGYTKYVVSISDAVKLAEILGDAERYSETWRTAEAGGTSYNIWEADTHEEYSVKVIPDALYRMYKLAGKPEVK